MKKIVKISIFIAVLALIGLLVFLGYRYIEKSNTLTINYGYYDFSKEKITESIEGDYKKINIKKRGLEFKTPNDWISTTENGPLTFKDEDLDAGFLLAEFREWTSGCEIDISLEKDTHLNNYSTFDYYFSEKETLKMDNEFCPYNYCEIETINGKEFLKYIFEAKDEKLGVTFQEVTFTYFNEEKREVLRVFGYLSSRVPECEEHLNQFVNTLKFN